MSGFSTNIVQNIVQRKLVDTYNNILEYIREAFYLSIAKPAGTNNKIIETREVESGIQDSVKYVRKHRYPIIHSASNWLELFRNREIISFFMPYEHMECYNKYGHDMITAVNYQLEKQADQVANRKKSTIFDMFSNNGTNNDADPEPMNEGLIQDESIKGINSNDCIFQLSRLVMEKMNLYIDKGITVKSQPSNTKKRKRTIEEKEYTINLPEINKEINKEEHDKGYKNFFENFISIPPDVEKYVLDNDKPGNRKDLPICYLGTNSNHSFNNYGH